MVLIRCCHKGQSRKRADLWSPELSRVFGVAERRVQVRFPLSTLGVTKFPGRVHDMSHANGWSDHSAVYDQVFASKTVQFAHDALVLANLPPNSKCLDVGCGSGAMTLLAAQRGHTVFATDFAPQMVQTLQCKIEKLRQQVVDDADAKWMDRITTAVMDGQTLEGIADNSFDVVLSNFGIFLFPDRLAAWRAARRVLKPNGVLVTTSWDAQFPPIRAERKLEAMIQMNPSRVEPPNLNATCYPDSFRHEVESCGFDRVQLESIQHEIVYESGQQVLVASQDNPFNTALRAGPQPLSSILFLEELSGKGIARDLPFQSSEVYRNPLHHPGMAHVCIARKPVE